MGILDIFKKKNDNNFDTWLDNILKNDLSNEIKAVNFNLYEDKDDKWSIEFIGASIFDENNSDWACNEVFTTRNNPYIITMKDNWENVEKIFIEKIKNYLANGKYSDKLKQYDAVAIGFVDGDLNILYKK